MRVVVKWLGVAFLVGGLMACAPDEAPVGFEPECRGSCTGKTCGDDGCGNSCGTCEAGVGCVDNRCVDLSICSDGSKNGEETDVDCGGRVCDPCQNGQSCLLPTDCATGHCEGFVCLDAPTCNDARKNGGETDVDCGGGECEPCASGARCVEPTDCLTGICTDGECRDPSCNDSIQNQDESDVDCGGPNCAPCSVDKTCLASTDCASETCEDFVCVPAATCSDNQKNGDESDVDCGGNSCLPCPLAKACRDGSDCASGTCENEVCVPTPTCNDNKKNQDESDIDCGGATCGPCATGLMCNAPTDCLSGICTNGLCRDPSCTDGLKNQNETDVDCGGICAAKCAAGEGCRVNGDCDSNVCDDGVCVNVGCQGVPSNGRCLNDSTIEYCALSPMTGASFVRTLACEGNATCRTETGAARCVVPGDACREGATSCLGSGTLRTCVNGKWASETCSSGCSDSNPFESFCKPAQASTSFSGKFLYETKTPNPSRTGWGAAAQVAGEGFLVVSMAVQDGESELKPFDAAFTRNGDGAFTVRVPTNPGVDDRIVVFALGLGIQSNHRYAVADPGFETSGLRGIGAQGTAPRIWNWSWRVNDLPANKKLVISAENGSGAARVFANIRSAFSKAESVYPARSGRSMVAWLGFDNEWECGSCFAPWPQTFANETYESQLWISAGTHENYWSDSRTLHELGHWVMSSFGTSPSEVGTQKRGFPTFAGQAWSEGFATWFSGMVRNDPVFVENDGGGMSWFDISAREYGEGLPWHDANPAGGLLQKMDANEVAAMLWAFGTTSTSTLLQALSSPRMNNAPWYRGHTRHEWRMSESGTHTNVVDTGVSQPAFPDFLDTLLCSGFPEEAIDAATGNGLAYPYSTAERGMCEGGCSPSNCGGCCQGNVCQPGTELSACGETGGACHVCNSNQACSNGLCVCNPASCPSGCCSGSVCAPGTANNRCGSAGLACVSCGTGKTCEEQRCKSTVGNSCNSRSDCAENLLCISEKSPPHLCRQACDPDQSTGCGSGFNCVKVGTSGGACVPAPTPNSKWRVHFDRAVIRKYDINGNNWDPGGAAPDPYLCVIFLPSGTKDCSTRRNSTRHPVWDEFSNEYPYSAFANVRFELWDYDSTSADDLMLISAESNLQPKRAGWSASYTLGHAPHPTNGVELVEFSIVPVP